MTGRRLALASTLVVLVGAATATVLYVAGSSDSGEPGDPAGVRVTWANSEDGPVCRYDRATRTVRARLAVVGDAREDQGVSVTVSAYADENTSDLVGSTTEVIAVGTGTAHRDVEITIPVARPSHRGEDGETACTLTVDAAP